MNMKIILISVVLLQAWCYAYPKPNGVATYSYQDSSGKRYGGTYDLGNSVVPYSDPLISRYSDAYVPDFFNNFGGILPHPLERMRRRLHIRHFRPLRSRFPFAGLPFGGFGPFNMNRLSHNSAFSGAAIGPGYTHQTAIINPPNADNPNVDVSSTFEMPGQGPNFYSVSSSSFASSNNDNGKLTGFRGAETVVNNNGKITKYKVHS